VRERRLTVPRLLGEARKMRRTRSLPLFLLLALLFAFAQQAALLHALSHNTQGDTQQDKHLPGAKVCEKCVVFAQFGAAVASAASQFHLSAAANDFLFQSHTSVCRQPAAPYLSRAPPVFS
jgi:hypothetical protein